MITNIRDIEKFRRAAWDWTPFNNCFRGIDGEATGIRISDIDGHVERKGHFLWFETTSKDTITRGQMLSIRHRVMRGDTAIIEYGWVMGWDSDGAAYDAHGSEILVLQCSPEGWQIIWRTQIPG